MTTRIRPQLVLRRRGCPPQSSGEPNISPNELTLQTYYVVMPQATSSGKGSEEVNRYSQTDGHRQAIGNRFQVDSVVDSKRLCKTFVQIPMLQNVAVPIPVKGTGKSEVPVPELGPTA